MTIGEKVSNAAKAVAAFCVALVSLLAAVLATLPSDVPDEVKSYVIWIQAALGFLTVASVWLTTNGPRIGTAIDALDEMQDALGGKHREP